MPSHNSSRRPVSKKIVVFGAVALLLIALSAFLAYDASRRDAKHQVRDAIRIISYTRTNVAVYMRDKEKFPDSIDATGDHPKLPPHISTLNLRGGVIVATFGSNANSTLLGKDVVYVPRIAPDGLFAWVCGSASLSHDLLPEDCRATDLSTNIIEQLEKRRKDSIAAAEVATQNAYGEALRKLQERFSQLNPNSSQYDRNLYASFEKRAAELVRQNTADISSALEYAAKEVLYEDVQRQSKIYQAARANAAVAEAQRARVLAARLKDEQDRMKANEARSAYYAQQATYHQQAARLNVLKEKCRFLFYINNDPTGFELAESAKQECLASDGRQGPAYSRWREQRESETTRRTSVAPEYNSGGYTECAATGYRKAECSSTSWTAPASQPDLASDLN